MARGYQGHNSLSALGAFLPKPGDTEITARKNICHNSLSALGAFLPYHLL